MVEQKRRAGFSTNSVQNLITGLAAIHHAWNGDIVNVRNQVDNPEDYRFETCKEGVPVGSDAMAIPINARIPRHRAALHRLDAGAGARGP